MLNGRTILLQVFCILFIIASAFGQEESDSHIITVTKKIDVEQLNENVEDLNDSVKTLTETISKLDKTVDDLSTTVGDLKVTVARIDERNKRNCQVAIRNFGRNFRSLAVVCL